MLSIENMKALQDSWWGQYRETTIKVELSWTSRAPRLQPLDFMVDNCRSGMAGYVLPAATSALQRNRGCA